jgi:hypothetical protein
VEALVSSPGFDGLLEEITDDDRDPSNLLLRAGYMWGLAAKAEGDDRAFLLKASRSLRAYAEALRGKS